MKETILGATLILSGIIGFSSWIIANMTIFQPGGVSSVISGLRSANAEFVAIIFLVIATVGLIISIIEIAEHPD